MYVCVYIYTYTYTCMYRDLRHMAVGRVHLCMSEKKKKGAVMGFRG